MSAEETDTQEAIRSVLHELTALERELLSQVVRLERDHLHHESPQLTKDLLKRVKEVVK